MVAVMVMAVMVADGSGRWQWQDGRVEVQEDREHEELLMDGKRR